MPPVPSPGQAAGCGLFVVAIRDVGVDEDVSVLLGVKPAKPLAVGGVDCAGRVFAIKTDGVATIFGHGIDPFGVLPMRKTPAAG